MFTNICNTPPPVDYDDETITHIDDGDAYAARKLGETCRHRTRREAYAYTRGHIPPREGRVIAACLSGVGPIVPLSRERQDDATLTISALLLRR